MDASPWANYVHAAAKLQQQQNQFNNNSNTVNNINRNNGSMAIQQQGCYNFNQNQMYTQNMESFLAHYSNNEAGFPGPFNSHHNGYDAEFLSNQFQNAAKASLSAAGLFKSSSKTKDNQHYSTTLGNNQLNANNFPNLNHDAGANFLSQHLPNWRHPNHHDVNNQPAKPFGVLPHQTSNNANIQTNNKHHHNQYTFNHNSNVELNGNHSLTKVCNEPNRTNGQLNKMNHSNAANNLLPAMMHQNLMQNSVKDQLNNPMINKHCNNFIENQTILNNSKSNMNKNQIPHHSNQTADQYYCNMLAMNKQQKMLVKTFNQAQQLVNQQRASSSNHNNASPCLITSNSTNTTVNPHMNFQKNYIQTQNANNSCHLINNNNLMNKTFNNAMVNNTYCSMMMGGIQINNYNVSNHNNLIISNQSRSNCPSATVSNNSIPATNQQTVNNFLMNNINNNNSNNGMINNNSNNLSNSRCSSVASVNNVQQINESSSCSYGNFSTNSPSFNNNSTNNAADNSPSNNRNLSSSQQIINVPNEFTNAYPTSFPHTPALSLTPVYPTPPSSVNRSEMLSQHSIQSSAQDEQLIQTQFNQNQFNGCNNNLVSYNKSNGGGYLNSNNQLNNLPDSNNSTNCLPNLMNITPVSDTTMSDNSKLNDSQCSTNAINMNVHSQHLETNNLQFNDELSINADAQMNFHNQNSNQSMVQTKKKKDKTKKKRKKVTNQLVNCETGTINGASYYPNSIQVQTQYPIYQSNSNCNGYFLNNMQQNQQINLHPTDDQLIQQHSNEQQLNQQCIYNSQNCHQLNNHSLNDSTNCSNEQMNLLNSTQHTGSDHMIANNELEDKLACLEDDLKYLTESNECMLNDEKDLSDEKAYTSDNSNNNSCSLDDSMMRHHQQQMSNEQVSLNGSLNGVHHLSYEPINNSINESPIDDLNKHYEFDESSLNENYAKNDYDLGSEQLDLNENKNSNLSSEDKKIKKKKKKDKFKVKLNGLVRIDGLGDKKLSKSLVKSNESTVPRQISTETSPLKSEIDNLDSKLGNQTVSLISSNSSIFNKKCKIERDEYEFTDDFAPTLDNCPTDQQLTVGGKKRKKTNCENVNKKNKSSLNSLNERLTKSFNSSKEKKEDKSNKSKLKVLTSKATNSEFPFKKNSVNSIETSSNASSSSSTSFSLNSKKENQDLVGVKIRLNANNHSNGHLNNNGAITPKSIILNTNNKNLNQNVVQVNNKKIITGKNINNQIESKKNEVSIFEAELETKNDKKELDSETLTNVNTKSNGSSSKSTTAVKRRSSEKKALTVREGLMRTSDFVISKEAMEKNLQLLWRIEGKSLLQLFTPVEENGSLYYQNTSSYSAWNPSLRERYIGVDVRIISCNRNRILVEKLSVNKSNGNMEDKLLCDSKEDLATLSSPSQQHSTNFAVYIQTLISQILDPHFIREIIEDNDEYFINHTQKIEECCLSKKTKIYSKIKWETSIVKCIETYPKCDAIPQENSGDLRCKFCYEKWSTHILNFTGEMYDPITLEHIRNDELKLNKYAACDLCKNKVIALSNLLHQKYHFFIKCGEKVEEMREGDDSKKYHVILEECLKDNEWIDSLFKELKEIWNSADKV